jgi:hypothetical protein
MTSPTKRIRPHGLLGAIAGETQMHHCDAAPTRLAARAASPRRNPDESRATRHGLRGQHQ